MKSFLNKPALWFFALLPLAALPLASQSAQSVQSKPAPLSLFEQAITEREQSPDPKAGQALFEQSAQAFESMAEQDHALWYEAGNARWWAGQAGLAVLNYRRFLSHDPFRNEVWENLAQARLAAQTIELAGEGLGSWPWSLWFLTSAGISLSFAALTLALKIYTRKTVFARLGLGLGIACLVFALAATISQANRPQLGVVLIETQGRKGDSEVYAIWPEAALKLGQEVWIKEERDGWFRVELGQTSTWLRASVVRLL